MEDVQRLENEEDAWLLAFFQGGVCILNLTACVKELPQLQWHIDRDLCSVQEHKVDCLHGSVCHRCN